MGSASSSHGRVSSTDEDEDDDEAEEEEEEEEAASEARSKSHLSIQEVLQNEPPTITCHSPLTPLSSFNTPRGGAPSIRVWDPCNVLLPRPPPPPTGFGPAGDDHHHPELEVYLVCHGECGTGLRPDLVGGRWPAAGLTGNGERQARALAVFLNSQGVRFGAVYSSPLDRARATAAYVCRELEFEEEQIQSSDSLIEMSLGHWEGCHHSEIYTPEMTSLIDRTQPDFLAPSGESLRQVQFRMIEFLNRTVLRLPEKLVAGESSLHRNEGKGLSHHDSTNSAQDRDGSQWDMLYKQRQGLQRKKSGKSRLQFVTTGDNETGDEFSPREANHEHFLNEGDTVNSTSSIGIFTHSIPIKCLLTGLLDCSPAMSQKICVDDSSVTVLQHSLHSGWQIKWLNDTSHLRLL